ncbi:MAG: hypothetical protein ACRDTA_20955, partial [Pseudonocardiaceae bacterium]
VSTVASAGLAVTPYHVHVPSFGDWGFVLAQASGTPPELRISPAAPELRFLDDRPAPPCCDGRQRCRRDGVRSDPLIRCAAR